MFRTVHYFIDKVKNSYLFLSIDEKNMIWKARNRLLFLMNTIPDYSYLTPTT